MLKKRRQISQVFKVLIMIICVLVVIAFPLFLWTMWFSSPVWSLADAIREVIKLVRK